MVGLLTSLGAKVYVLGTTRPRGDHPGTCQTPGLPDLLVFLPEFHQPRHLLCIEAKRPKGGRFSPEQEVFRDLCRDANVSWVGGSLNVLIAWLIEHQYLKAENVPHYRLPKNLQESNAD